MNYIYSELASQLASTINYAGKNSYTAAVTVDDRTKTITVDVGPTKDPDPAVTYYKKDDQTNYILLISRSDDGSITRSWIEVDSLYKKVSQLQYELIDNVTKVASGLEVAGDTKLKSNLAVEGQSSFKGEVVIGEEEANTSIEADNVTTSNIEAKNIHASEEVVFDRDISVDGEQIKAYVDAETVRAKDEEAHLAESLINEINRAKGEETNLRKQIAEEETRATAKEEDLEGAIETERERAKGVESGLDIAIKAEASRADEVEKQLRADLTTETNRATEAETTLQSNIDAEATTARAAEKALQDNIDAEQTRAEARAEADETLISNNKDQIAALNTALGDETARAKTAEEGLSSSLQTINSELTTSINKEISDREAADTAVKNEFNPLIEGLRVDLTGESTRAKGVEDTLTTNLTTEKSRAEQKESELEGKINDEISRATNKEQAVEDKHTSELNAEIEARKSEITRVEGLITEKVSPESLNQFITGVSYIRSTEDDGENILTLIRKDEQSLETKIVIKNGSRGEVGPTGPEGPQGPKGNDGTSVNVKANQSSCEVVGDAYIDAAGNLQVLTSLPDTFTSAGQIKGPQGDTGPQGPQGEKGDKGDTGSQGPQGIQGEVGPKGDKGDKGDQGEQGPKGDKGDPGSNGKDGATGPTGPTGATGATGPTGPTGAAGPTGKDGTGVSIKADKTACTVIGDAYIDQTTGHLWVLTTTPSTFTDAGEIKGPKGDTGATGATGVTGPTGPAGVVAVTLGTTGGNLNSGVVISVNYDADTKTIKYNTAPMDIDDGELS